MLHVLRGCLLVSVIILMIGALSLAHSPENLAAMSRDWARGIALFSSGISMVMFVLVFRQKPASHQYPYFLMYIIALGTLLRLWFAMTTPGNFDQRSYEIVADIVAQGGNIYAETNRYNYSPVWFILLHLLNHLTVLPLYIEVRVFLTLVDLAILGVLSGITRQQRLDRLPIAVCFYLNPVLILITGYHGQFENLALLALLGGIFAYIRLEKTAASRRIGWLWLGATTGLIIKHIVFYEVIIVMQYAVRRWWLKLTLLSLSALLFLATFLPFWEQGQSGIIHNVFLYRSLISRYGFAIFNSPIATILFIAALVVYSFLLRSSDLLTRCLQGSLFFLTFTTGISIQYFMLPLIFGAVRRSPGFFLYTCAATLALLGHYENVAVPGFQIFGEWIVWVAALVWFIGQMLAVHQEKRREKSSPLSERSA